VPKKKPKNNVFQANYDTNVRFFLKSAKHIGTQCPMKNKAEKSVMLFPALLRRRYI
jgi:hypothetical protein